MARLPGITIIALVSHPSRVRISQAAASPGQWIIGRHPGVKPLHSRWGRLAFNLCTATRRAPARPNSHCGRSGLLLSTWLSTWPLGLLGLLGTRARMPKCRDRASAAMNACSNSAGRRHANTGTSAMSTAGPRLESSPVAHVCTCRQPEFAQSRSPRCRMHQKPVPPPLSLSCRRTHVRRRPCGRR